MELLTSTDHGDWLLSRAGSWARVDGVAGTGFEAYARILHPVDASRVDLGTADPWGVHPTIEEARWTWAEVARRNGRIMHPLVQWLRITDDEESLAFPDGWRAGQIEEGRLAPDVLAALTDHLRATTRTPQDLVAAVWSGHAELHGPPVRYVSRPSGPEAVPRPGPAERHDDRTDPAARRRAQDGPWWWWPERPMLLFSTDIRELADPAWVERAGLGWTPSHGGGITPQMLWPAGHEWVLASEIDWDSTIVAGPRALVDAVLGDPRVEAFEVTADADLTRDGDTVNLP